AGTRGVAAGRYLVGGGPLGDLAEGPRGPQIPSQRPLVSRAGFGCQPDQPTQHVRVGGVQFGQGDAEGVLDQVGYRVAVPVAHSDDDVALDVADVAAVEVLKGQPVAVLGAVQQIGAASVAGRSVAGRGGAARRPG